MKSVFFSIAAAALLLTAGARPARAAIDVVTTTPELAAIAREVGGSLVRVTSLTRPDQDYHRVEAKPTDVMRVRNADVFVRVGMDMDMWAGALMSSARNPNVGPGGRGYVDAGRLIRKKEVPTGSISGASGDIHVLGNPHYWYDPANGKVIAYQILLALRAVDNKNAAAYDANYKRFSAEIDRRLAGWRQEMAPFRGKPVVAYHAEWVYFYDRFGLRPFGYLEPKPGIPPSGSHVNNLIARMKGAKIQGVILPSIYATRFAEMVARETGGDVVVVPYSVGSRGTTNYFNYIDAIVDGFRRALR